MLKGKEEYLQKIREENGKKTDADHPFHLKKKRSEVPAPSALAEDMDSGLAPVVESPSYPELTPDTQPLPPSPPVSVPPLSASRPRTSGRVRLGCDISKDYHCRLRIHAIKSGRPVVAFIEEWIEMHCPAE